MAKVLIDVSKRMNELIHSDSQIGWMNMSHILYTIKNGIALDGLTNGEALCMLFPNMHYTLSDKSPRVVTTIGIASSFDLDWWNRKWGE